jgi:hypothetical protein
MNINLALLLSPYFLSAITAVIRGFAGFNLTVCGVLAICLYLALLAIGLKYEVKPFGECRRVWLAFSLSFLCCAFFFAPNSYGFVNMGAADGGNHMIFFHQYVDEKAGVYNNFLGFYSLLSIFKVLFQLNLEWALLLSLGYLTFCSSFILMIWGLSLGASGWLLCLTNLLVFIPLLLYLQGNGFYPQSYALLTFVICLSILDKQRGVSATFLGVLTTALFIRYGYGLNLPDLLLGAGLWFASRRRLVLAAALCGAALLSAVRLTEVIAIPGAVTRGSVSALLVGMVLLFTAGRDRSSLVSLVALSSLIIWVYFGTIAGFDSYYVAKYPMMLCVLLGVLALKGFASGSSRARLVLAGSYIALLINVFPYTKHALAVVERRTVRPEVDLGAISAIRSYLKDNNQSFAGFWSDRWPRTNMINSLFNREIPYSEFIAGDPSASNGCIFFDKEPGLMKRSKRRAPVGTSPIPDLLSREPHIEIPYSAPWSSKRSRALGVKCA